MSPGDGPGVLTIQGNYTQVSNAALNIEIDSATSYDQLNVTGTATLAGTLNVTLGNGYVPSSLNSFNVLSFGSKSGDFTTYNLPAVENYTLLSAASNATSLNLAGTAYTYVVTKTADDGSTGTLRDAINQVNNQSVAPLGVIVFDIPGTGVQTIQVQSALPAITKAAIIDGYTQPGASRKYAGNRRQCGAADRAGPWTGTAAGVTGLTIAAGGTTVKGLDIGGLLG